jgi:hypothetical protein
LRIIRKAGPGADQLKKMLAGIDAHISKVGWFESAKYPDGTPVAYIAAIQEFGSPSNKIPPRAFMRPTTAKQEKYWASVATRIAKKFVKGEATVKDVMEKIGLTAAADFQKAITQVKEPPLSEVTLLLRKWRKEGRKITGVTVLQAAAELNNPKRKGKKIKGVSTKPLVETGYMLSTLISVTERK